MRSYLQVTWAAEVEEIRERERASRDPLEKRRLCAIRLRSEGYSPPDVCRILCVHQSSLRNWVNAFNREGFTGLAPQERRAGRKRRLSEEQIAEVCRWLDEGPSEHHGCCFWTGKSLARAIEEAFGIRYTTNGIYELLKDLGYTRLVPKTRHHKSDPKAAEEFKKNFPVWSRG